ncbi:hypothetical protein JCM11641_000021 [Rhodosporidiobolus odoratus]
MPNNKVKTNKSLQGKKKSAGGHIHPNSRRAKQLQRVELRARKLETQGRVRRALEVERVDRHLYFVHALPSDSTSLSLPELHALVVDYINRHESEMVQLAAEREGRNNWRKTEGKGKREVEIEKEREELRGEYKSGFIVPDLTQPENVIVCRQWVDPAPAKEEKRTKGGDPSYLGRIRLIRLTSLDPNDVKVEQNGAKEAWGTGEGEVEMGDMSDDDEEEEVVEA